MRYKFMTSYNIYPLHSKSSLGGFKMHDKFISESPYRRKSELLR